MDIQLKKGMLDVCVLKCLRQEDSYGYRIIQQVSEYITISESTLYPILKRLEKANCLTTYSKEYQGRLRKYYSITPLGIEKIESFKAEYYQLKRIYDFILCDKGGENG